MIVKSFGCSFIYGNELNDGKTASDQTWPALLARHWSLPYQCYANPGAGNSRIAEQVLNQIATGQPAIYIIGWTFTERFDFFSRETEKWRTLTAWSKNKTAEYYYKDIHSQYLDKYQSLSQTNLVLQQLKQHGCRFFMTYMDELLFETEFHCSPAMHLMQTQLRPYLHNFDGKNFLQWSQDHGYALGSLGNHPLQQAHQAAAQYVIDHHNF